MRDHAVVSFVQTTDFLRLPFPPVSAGCVGILLVGSIKSLLDALSAAGRARSQKRTGRTRGNPTPTPAATIGTLSSRNAGLVVIVSMNAAHYDSHRLHCEKTLRSCRIFFSCIKGILKALLLTSPPLLCVLFDLF